MATTPNMNLVLPEPSVTAGPKWATLLADALEQVDAHDHSPGNGARIGTAGLNIKDDLPITGANVADAGGVQFRPGSATIAGPMLYVDGAGELHFINAAAQDLQLTGAGALNLTANRGFNGQYATDVAVPSAFYTTSLKRYTFTATSGGVLAQARTGGLLVGVLAASASFTIGDTDATHTVSVNTAASVTITLPSAVNCPGRQLTIKDNTGGAAAHPITVSRAGADLIDGATSQTVNANRGVLRLVSNGTGWMMV